MTEGRTQQGLSMQKAVVFVCVMAAGGAWADANWTPQTSDQITALLTDRGLVYERARQRFYASGRTLYKSGQDSWGYWRAEGDQYCSTWPPGDGWECYGLELSSDGQSVRFLGHAGDISLGRFAE